MLAKDGTDSFTLPEWNRGDKDPKEAVHIVVDPSPTRDVDAELAQRQGDLVTLTPSMREISEIGDVSLNMSKAMQS